MKKLLNSIKIIAVLFLLSNCTTIGMHRDVNKDDYGPPEEFRICLWQDTDLSDEQRDKVMNDVIEEFKRFNIDITIPWIKPWERTEFQVHEEFEKIIKYTIKPPCDRYFVLLGRDFGDTLWSLTLLPEQFGEVDDMTLSKGVTVAEWGGSINMLVSFMTPSSIAIHETYHLLGCGHSNDARDCYAIIKRMKAAARENRAKGNDFFPSRSHITDETLWERW